MCSVVKKSKIGNQQLKIGNGSIAIFGGTFDPPHNGHVQIAVKVLAAGLADRIIFVPAYRPPHKPGFPVSEFRHRLEMLKLATAGKGKFEVSDMESRRNGPSYTFDTMLEFEKKNPASQIKLLVGSDSLRLLHTWYKAREIAAKWTLIAYPREGQVPTSGELRANWDAKVAEKLLGYILHMPCYDFSSTEIRKRIIDGKNVEDLVDGAVYRYIIRNRIYS
ncbi:MAG TPA: nicotinate (nicotinamide) nucleotide adenylyltransferase [Lentisphaeria bacterium]|nr:MAG: nicotinate (nicotinamide) nucleotide adenylyltransferase [Lentisphaerae bacterium GWF2_49_21]HBC87368.1 nicotinate (nicotinamide) nucleotide adenylyltransferase [Lentisphaeria bacterium]